MESFSPLEEMGNKIYKLRKKEGLNQINFYKTLFPEKNLEDENIKKKMNAIENGKYKKADYELLFRIHDKYNISLDYLFGYETNFPNYENKAVHDYIGLSPEAIKQLHFWNNCNNEPCTAKLNL